MKQIYIQNQDQQGNNDASAVTYQLFCTIKSYKLFTPTTTFAIGQRQNGGHDIFLIRNKGKGPPGRTRSPGMAYCSTRDNQPLAFNPHHPELCHERRPEFIEGLIEGFIEGSLPEPVEGKNQIENELIIHIKPNFLTQVNFLIMKKQILFLAFFVLAVMAGITDSFGQSATHNTPASGLTCTDDALHPIAGKPYEYGVGVSPSGGEYQYWATKQSSFIQGGAVNLAGSLTVTTSELLAAGVGYGALGSSESMTITWTSEILANTVFNTNPTFVAVMYSNAPNVCANNFKAYQIDPKNGFTLDIFAMQDAATTLAAGATASSCVGDVASATWDGSQITFDYGTSTATFEIVAANFSTEFLPTFRVTLNAAQTAEVQWSYTADFATVEFTSATTPAGGGDVVSTVSATTSVTDTSTGVSIYARLIIHNNTFEAIAADTRTLTLAVDAVNSVGQPDVDNTDCNSVLAFEDVATHELQPRPTLTPTTPTPPVFVPGNDTH